jgi:hypothetical protein
MRETSLGVRCGAATGSSRSTSAPWAEVVNSVGSKRSAELGLPAKMQGAGPSWVLKSGVKQHPPQVVYLKAEGRASTCSESCSAVADTVGFLEVHR